MRVAARTNYVLRVLSYQSLGRGGNTTIVETAYA